MGQISCCQPPPPKLDDFELLEEAKKRGLKIEMPETSPKQPPAAYLCREQSKEENANLRQIFDKFDKNKNGSIDVNEIMELCKALGAEISKFEAQEAMIQLDKNDNGQCDFEEFVQWWSSQPGLGGYSSLTLMFLKLRLATGAVAEKLPDVVAPSAANVVVPRAGSTKLTPLEHEKCVLKASVELGPGMGEAVSKMSGTVSLNKGSTKLPYAGQDACIVVRLIAPSSAREVADVIQSVISDSPLPPGTTVNVEQGKMVLVSVPLPPPPEQVKAQIAKAMDALEQAKVSVSVGGNLNECLKLASEPAPVMLQKGLVSFRVSVDLCVSKGGKEFLISNAPGPAAKSLIDLFAGMEGNFHVGYNSPKFQQLLEAITSEQMSNRQMPKLSDLQKDLKQKVLQSPPPPPVMEAYEKYKIVAAKVTGIESVSLENLPGGAAITCKFEDFNPVPLLSYILEPLDGANPNEAIVP